MEGSIKQCGFHNFDFLLVIGMLGGIWLIWNVNASKPYNLSVIHNSNRFRACNISIFFYESYFVAIFIILLLVMPLNNFFWEDLITYLKSLSIPFITLGDFDELSSHLHKLGGLKFRFSRIAYINLFFDTVE